MASSAAASNVCLPSAGLAVLPFCPFVRGYIARHSEEYLDLVPADLRDSFYLAADA